MKKLLIISVFILLVMPSVYAQTTLDIVEKYALDTASVFSEIRTSFDRDAVLAGRKDLTICPVYKFIDDKWHDKEAYLDYSFLGSFEPCYSHPERFSKWRAFWSWLTGKSGWIVDKERTLVDFYEYKVYDSLGLVVGVGPYRGYGCFSCMKLPEDTVVEKQWTVPTDMLFNRRLDYLMAVLRTRPEEGHKGSNVGFYYGIDLSENQIYVVIPAYMDVKVYTLEVIVSDYWDDFKVGLPHLLEELRQEGKGNTNR